MDKVARLLAYYLPQYHPTPENDKWWGAGFTEWTNVTKAKPLFKGHKQPRHPADLGYYDLRVPEVRERQAQMALEYGIEGFVYYHYWFGNGKRLLERPFNEVLHSKSPDIPFCLCWANETWKGVWFGSKSPEVLIAQEYPGKKDYEQHFAELLKAFTDSRYICVDGMPLFQVYMPTSIPDLALFVDTFRNCALKAGLKGIYLLAGRCPLDWDPAANGFDGVVGSEFSHLRYYTAPYYESKTPFEKAVKKIYRSFVEQPNINVESRTKPIVVEYETAIQYLITKSEFDFDYYPCAVPNWDNTPRAGVKGLVFHNSTPELWRKHLIEAINKVSNRSETKRIVFIKSWNEWAEGNYLEPDSEWGYEYLKVIKEEIFKVVAKG